MPRSRKAVAERPDDTRERVIDAAQAIFARDGYAGASMREIADRVGIQRPSLFYHFKNKEALFVAAHEQVFTRIAPLFQEMLAPDGDPFAQLDRLSRAVLSVTAEEPDFARMMARTAVDRHPASVAIVRRYVRPLVDLGVTFIREQQRRGVFNADVDAFFLTLSSWSAALLFTARDLFTDSQTRGRDDLERFTRTLLQMGNRALAVDRPRITSASRSAR